ncbi:Ubiquitin fusion degradation protein 4, partial [Tulasnella sp. 403]
MAAKASPRTTVALLDADIVSTMHQILAGVLPPMHDDGMEQGQGPGGQGLGGGLADMAVMQNLAHRPKEQVEEALSLISELMPPLPKDGVFDHRAYTEKALAKMIKAKGKADRAAARAAAAASSGSHGVPPSSNVPTPVSVSDEAMPEPVPVNPIIVDDPSDSQNAPLPFPPGDPNLNDPILVPGSSGEKEKDKTATRTEILREKPELVHRFLRIMVPVLVDVYAASVALQVRSRSLTGLLKAISWMDADELSAALKNVPVASFVGSILSSKDNPVLIIGALQIVDLLLAKLPQLYRPSFRREGVLHEIEVRAAQDLTTKVTKPPAPAPPPEGSGEQASSSSAPVPSDSTPSTTDSSDPANANPPPVVSGDVPPPNVLISSIPAPIVKRSSSSSLDPQDAIILRCRIIRFKYLMSPSVYQGDDPLETMQALGRRLTFAQASETEIRRTLTEVAALFAGGQDGSVSVSSFELMKSGLVDELLEFSTAEGRKVDLATRQRLLLEAFTTKSGNGTDTSSPQSPLAILVKRLQESLTRLENFEVVMVSQGEDSKRGAATMLARQLRLRLVAAEGTTVPRSCTNITVSIHAIATFQALHDYLRPRVAGAGPGSSRLNGVLAAFAAAAGIPSGSLGRSGTTSLPGGTPPPGSLSMPPPAPASSAPPSGAASAPPNPEPAPRRSLRLRKEPPPPTTTTELPAGNRAAPEPLIPPLAPDMVDHDDMEDDFLGDDFDSDLYDDGRPMPNERTISVAVAEDGEKVEAQTPEGTRVATPNPAASSTSSLPTKASYASALKAKPLDWHIQFSMDDHPLPLDMTVYGAVHQHIVRKGSPALPLSSLWNGVYTIKFKKVPGPVPVEDSTSTERASSPVTTSAPDDSPHSKILRLLRVLHKLNMKGSERLMFDRVIHTLPDSAFVNNKLTAKLTRQLEEPMIVASSCLPDWALDLPQHYAFLFPFATRFAFLQSTSFGYARLILKWQSQQSRSSESNSRRDDAFGYLGRLQRQKVRISRKFLLESAIKVLELYGSSSSVLEVEYFDEVGTGLGPTLEFYSLVSKEFARKNIKMWHDADPHGSGPYVSHPTGLYPAPLSRKEVSESTLGATKKRLDIFRVLGQFSAKALLDSRIIDISLNKIFLKFILGEEVPVTLASLKVVDPALAQSLSKLQAYVDLKRDIEAKVATSAAAKRNALSDLVVDGTRLEDLSLDFTLPGYDIELREGGRDISVDASNIEEYMREVLDALVGRGVQLQAQAFREGFSKVFPVTDLQSFTADELSMMFGNADEDWSLE